jgi:eukaryotic-like serine/threonine-protein kinase
MLVLAVTHCRNCDEALEDDAKFCGMCGATLIDENFERLIGERYQVQHLIGAGSLGTVYRGEQRGTHRKIAIKLLAPSAQHDPAAGARFEREAAVLMQLRSPHTVSIYDSGREPDGTLFIVMELSPGRSLAHVLEREGRLPWPRVMRILLGLCESLAEAHSINIIHRDLTPKNILVEERPTTRDFIKVSDFGLVKVLGMNTRISPVGQTVGAVEYAAPESLMHRPIDGRSDLYALGVLAFLLLSGRHPFAHARSYGDMIAAHVKGTPAPISTLVPDIPADVEALLDTLLQKDPERRYADANTLAAQIRLLMWNVPSDPGPGMTVRTLEGEEDTFLSEIPSKPK